MLLLCFIGAISANDTWIMYRHRNQLPRWLGLPPLREVVQFHPDEHPSISSHFYFHFFNDWLIAGTSIALSLQKPLFSRILTNFWGLNSYFRCSSDNFYQSLSLILVNCTAVNWPSPIIHNHMSRLFTAKIIARLASKPAITVPNSCLQPFEFTSPIMPYKPRLEHNCSHSSILSRRPFSGGCTIDGCNAITPSKALFIHQKQTITISPSAKPIAAPDSLTVSCKLPGWVRQHFQVLLRGHLGFSITVKRPVRNCLAYWEAALATSIPLR